MRDGTCYGNRRFPYAIKLIVTIPDMVLNTSMYRPLMLLLDISNYGVVPPRINLVSIIQPRIVNIEQIRLLAALLI